MINDAFLDFVRQTCEASLANKEERVSFMTCLERAPEEIAKMLAESREGLAIRAENRKIIKSRFDVTPDDDVRVMEFLKEYFLCGGTDDTSLSPDFFHLPRGIS